ncbi:hypothetical protein AB0K48_13560 [Nonomuraea sp. NPDC055795]
MFRFRLVAIVLAAPLLLPGSASAVSAASASQSAGWDATGYADGKALGGIGRATRLTTDNVWGKPLPRINTNPTHTFTGKANDHIATICWIQGDPLNGTNKWDLVINRVTPAPNAVGYVSQSYIAWPSDTPCGQS